MRVFILTTFLCIAACSRVFSAEPVFGIEAEGAITADAVWSGSVIVYGDVLVPEGVTLTIQPGTTVYFAYTDSSKIEPVFLSMQTELLVRGTLLCNGTKDSPVTFKPAPEDEDLKAPRRGDWGGIIFDGGESSNSVVRGARFMMADIAVSSFYSSPEVAGCVMTDCEYGVYAAGGGSPRIIDCEISGCEFGVVAHGKAKPELLDIQYSDNAQDTLIGEDG
jgi:hypothetical protein